ncbi:MAG: alpha/beta fold hydrolase, partial [Sphingomonas bacterium]|nr:alpha/beta fold hydrolase [Sphingomonas bacterium]
MFLLALALLAAPIAASAPPAPTTQPARSWPTTEADYNIPDFHFRSGETLPTLRIHYTMLGQPHRNAAGEIDNAVMVLHGTGGWGGNFL